MTAARPDLYELSRKYEGWRDDLSCHTSDGEDVPVEVSVSMVQIDGRPRMLAILREREAGD